MNPQSHILIAHFDFRSASLPSQNRAMTDCMEMLHEHGATLDLLTVKSYVAYWFSESCGTSTTLRAGTAVRAIQSHLRRLSAKDILIKPAISFILHEEESECSESTLTLLRRFRMSQKVKIAIEVVTQTDWLASPLLMDEAAARMFSIQYAVEAAGKARLKSMPDQTVMLFKFSEGTDIPLKSKPRFQSRKTPDGQIEIVTTSEDIQDRLLSFDKPAA